MRAITLGAVLLAAVLSCSGGGGSGGGSGADTAAAQGPILGFGSIFVGGNRWDVRRADILRGGVAVSEDELALGMVVRVEGRHTGPGRGRASRVIVDDEVEGPISSISEEGPDRLLIEVFGLSIVLDRGRTVFEDTSFDTLAVGDVIEASGLIDSDGSLLASFVEGKGRRVLGVSEVELEGIVANADPDASSFEIRGVTIEVDAGTKIDSDLGAFVEDGDVVEVRGILVAEERVLARKIDLEDDLEDDFDDFEVEGIVSDFVSLADFRVAGIPVDASSAVFIPDRPDLVTDGARVEAEGSLVGGVLVADQIKLRGSDVRISAAVAADGDVDPFAGTVTLLGIPIVVPSSLELEDDRDDLPDFGLDDIVAGDFLEVRGLDDGAGGVLATRFERDEVDDVELRGRVEAFDAVAETLEILGVLIHTDGFTEFELEDDTGVGRALFFDLLEVGALVEVEDEVDGDATSIDVADEVEFEDED